MMEAHQLPTEAELLEALRPARARIRGHGGEISIASISEEGAVGVQLEGACFGCPAAAFTFVGVVKPAVEAIAGVTSVECQQVNASRFVVARIESLLKAG
jgi:Fe-S cluster biogenesis protein NfuA